MYFLIDIKVERRAEFNFAKIDVAGAMVTRGGKTFFRKAYKRGVDLADSPVIGLVKQTMEKGELPARREIARELGKVTRNFVRNPVKATREGFARERLVKQMLQDQGLNVPSKGELVSKATRETSKAAINSAKKYLSDPDNKKNLIVNTMGFTGSVVGGAVGGPMGQLAGDLGGAMVMRKAIQDYEATAAAIVKARAEEGFKALSPLDKLRKIVKGSLQEVKEMAEKGRIADDATSDIQGWAVGNTVANTVPIPLPFKGAIAAGITEADVVAAGRRIRAGEDKGKVVKETIDKILSKPKSRIRS